MTLILHIHVYMNNFLHFLFSTQEPGTVLNNFFDPTG